MACLHLSQRVRVDDFLIAALQSSLAGWCRDVKAVVKSACFPAREALQSIALLVQHLPNAIVGAGTVLSAKEATRTFVSQHRALNVASQV